MLETCLSLFSCPLRSGLLSNAREDSFLFYFYGNDNMFKGFFLFGESKSTPGPELLHYTPANTNPLSLRKV